MTSMATTAVFVTVGVDTHGHTHHAAVLDYLGRQLGDREFPTSPAGYRALLQWMSGHGVIDRVGVEGTGTYGVGLARHLREAGVQVVEVDRPDRRARRAQGKSDVEGAGEWLVLRVDQTVAELTADQVTVTPTVPVEPTTDGAALILRFADSLSYATTYEIVAKVQSATTVASATLTYSFRTPDGAIYTLERAASNADTEAPDQIVHHFLGSTEQWVVRSQPRIEQYAVADPAIAVLTSDAAGAATLTVGLLDGSEPTQTLADNSDMSQLKSSGPNGLLGFVLTPLNDPDLGGGGQLHLYNPVTGKLIKVSGFDGKPLEPLDWAFVPGTTSIVAQTADNSFYLIDPLNGRPTQPLGGHSRMYGFVPGSTTLIVDDNGGYKAIDLATGNTSRIPALDLPEAAGLQQLLPLGGDRGYVGWMATEAGAASVVVINDGNVRQIYAEDPNPSGGIQNICLSPNGQYLAVAKLPRDIATNPDSSGFANKTEFVDTATGQMYQDVAGSQVNWCN